MAFCSNCGNKLENGARFCPGCGAPIGVGDISRRQQVFEGNVHKCPNCGEIINAFSAKCPSCGHEFRDAHVSSAVKEFAKQLQEIESRRKSKSKLSGFAEAFGIKCSNTTDEQKINFIRSFSVPNTKEDVFEFLILASSNIDETLYENNNSSIEKSVSNAWIAKTEQVYNKAKIAFGADPDFVKIQNIYDNKMKQVKKSKGKITKPIIVVVIFLILYIGFLAFMVMNENRKEAELEAQLNATVVEIQQDIEEGDYDAALIKANGLRFDSSLDKEKAQQWDEQREYLIDLINEKKGVD